MKLLDTTFLIHYWGGVDATARFLADHEDHEFVTTTLNLKELAVGRALQGSLDRHEIQSTFYWVRLCPFERDHAFVAGRMEASLHRRDDLNRDKLNALTGDLLIAAVAKAEGATVVTRNVEDFTELDVPVDTY